MKCAECNENLETITGDFQSKNKSLGDIIVPEISYTKCNNCGVILLDPEMAQKITTFKRQREIELIKRLPVGEFLTVTEVIEVLEITKQAFSKNNKIKRNFIYNINIGKKKLYHRKSVELFKSTGDGRFLLSKQQKQSNKGEFKAQYDLKGFSPFLQGNNTADLYTTEEYYEEASYA